MHRAHLPLKLIRDQNRTVIGGQDFTLLEGTEFNNGLELEFVEGSGIRAPFPLIGNCSMDDFHLSGNGPVQLGELQFDAASVEVTPSGITVSLRLRWAEKDIRAYFNPGKKHGSWRGVVYAQDLLHCRITKPEVLRTSVTVETSTSGEPPTGAVLAVIESRNIEIPLAGDLQHYFAKGFAELRGVVLRAVSDSLITELSTNEQTLAELHLNEAAGELALRFDDPVFPSAIAGPILSRARTDEKSSRVIERGYIPENASSVSDRPRTPMRIQSGYVPEEIPASRVHSRIAPSPMGSSQGHSIASGYLSGDGAFFSSPVKGYVPAGQSESWASRESLRAGTRDRVELEQRANSETADIVAERSADIERVAYAILRSKDLLRAIESATASGV